LAFWREAFGDGWPPRVFELGALLRGFRLEEARGMFKIQMTRDAPLDVLPARISLQPEVAWELTWPLGSGAELEASAYNQTTENEHKKRIIFAILGFSITSCVCGCVGATLAVHLTNFMMAGVERGVEAAAKKHRLKRNALARKLWFLIYITVAMLCVSNHHRLIATVLRGKKCRPCNEVPGWVHEMEAMFN
jgi:hypothetical protein